MRIVILTQYYPPETGAPQNRLSDLARRLVEAGHQVDVVTAMPSYPLGRIFPEWRRHVATSGIEDGVTVRRSWIFATARKSTPLQLLSYLSFMLSSLCWLLGIGRADVLLWESPPLFLSITAAVFRKRLSARLVMNVSDLWPRSAIEVGVLRSGPLVSFFEAWERSAYRRANLVTHQTEHIGAEVRRISPGTRTALFPNGVDRTSFRADSGRGAARAHFGLPAEAVIVGYAGNFGRGQALEQLIEAASLIGDQRDDVLFWLLGDGPCKIEVMRRCAELGLKNVRFQPPKKTAEMPQVLAVLDIAVVPLADLAVLDGARPSKMFELMAAEVPFVYCGRGEGAAIAESCGGATVVAPQDPHALAKAIMEWIDAPLAIRGKAGHTASIFVAERFDRASIAKQIESEFNRLLTR